ncbi:MAG: (2Fe-2S)-binding protein [Alcaligenaceae bacterium]|nr:(2Fe-2S)-binding protein [Alcaligenaceae bacterium]|tara:strand:- start:1165 stop:1671 length:507 start_codon:yes stop_codon:yes gene_type:complete
METTNKTETISVNTSINGKPRQFAVEPRMHLADALREIVDLTGTKVGCEQGICGTCTILVDGQPMRSCLMLAVQAEGKQLETIEGLNTGPSLTVLQDSFQRNHALQCGFCTAGILNTARAFLKENPSPTRDEVREALSGNICRCTGYENIVDAIVDPAVLKVAQEGGL